MSGHDYWWVIGYDIAEPHRLNRVHRFMTGYAAPIEYSLFIFRGTEEKVIECLNRAETMLDRKKDDLRCYSLPEAGLRLGVGSRALPEGLQWSGLPSVINRTEASPVPQIP